MFRLFPQLRSHRRCDMPHAPGPMPQLPTMLGMQGRAQRAARPTILAGTVYSTYST